MLNAFNSRLLSASIVLACASLNTQASELAVCENGIAQLSASPELYKLCPGFYVGGGLGVASLKPRINGTNEVLDSGTSFVVPNLLLGYDINEHWSVEANYVNQGEATFKSGAAIGYDYFGISGLYYFPHNLLGFSGYLRAGVGSLNTSLNHGRDDNGVFNLEQLNSAQITLGAGGEYRWQNDWSARIEALAIDKDSQQLTLNVVKRFGRDYTPPPKPVVLPPPPPPAPVVEVPIVIPQPVCKELKALFDQIFFKTASAELTTESLSVLQKVATALKPFPTIALQVSAHTDAQGSDEYNLGLSDRRAASVVNYLSSQGVGKLTAKGFGESKPVADNKTAEGRAKNRRVELAAEAGKLCE